MGVFIQLPNIGYKKSVICVYRSVGIAECCVISHHALSALLRLAIGPLKRSNDNAGRERLQEEQCFQPECTHQLKSDVSILVVVNAVLKKKIKRE